MTEIAAGGGVAGLALYATKMLNDIAGPTAKVTGTVLAEWAELRLRNWLGITSAAAELVEDHESDSGEVHPQVLNRILGDGTWVDDDVTQRYLGGVLAASRTDDGREVRGGYYANLLSFMTPDQVRLHHVVYSALANDPPQMEYADKSSIRHAGILFRVADLAGYFPGEHETLPIHVLSEAAAGLARDELTNGQLIGDPSDLEKLGITVGEPSALFYPSVMGILLYLWGCGIRTGNPDRIARQPRPMLRQVAPMVEPVGIKNWTEG